MNLQTALITTVKFRLWLRLFSSVHKSFVNTTKGVVLKILLIGQKYLKLSNYYKFQKGQNIKIRCKIFFLGQIRKYVNNIDINNSNKQNWAILMTYKGSIAVKKYHLLIVLLEYMIQKFIWRIVPHTKKFPHGIWQCTYFEMSVEWDGIWLMGKYVFHASALDRMREKNFGDSFHGTNVFNIELVFL